MLPSVNVTGWLTIGVVGEYVKSATGVRMLALTVIVMLVLFEPPLFATVSFAV